MAIPSPGFYYKLQLKTAEDLYVCIDYRGVAVTAGYNADYKDFYSWLFVPTENVGEYWIFNKGAQKGQGQALTKPSNNNSLGQWDFTGNNDQRFILTDKGESKIRLKLKSNGQIVSTRWRWDLFTWDDNDEDEQRLVFIQDGAIKRDDNLVSFIFWNINNSNIKNYFIADCNGFLPNVKRLQINEFVFINKSGKKIIPAIHHFGCGDAPWRDGMAQCWDKNVGEYTGRASMEVSIYLKNADVIWLAIGSGLLVGLSIVTLGAASPLAAAVEAESIGAEIAVAALLVSDIGVVIFDGIELIRAINDASTTKQDLLNMNIQMETLGLDNDTAIALQEELGDYLVSIKGDVYEEQLNGWYVHECNSNLGFEHMFFGSGKAVYVVSDFPPEGIWKGDFDDSFINISKDGLNLSLAYSSSPGGEVEKGPYIFSPDLKVANRYNSDKYGKYDFLSRDKLLYTPNGESIGKKMERIFDVSGIWQSVPLIDVAYQEIEHDGLNLKSNSVLAPSSSLGDFKQESGNSNNYNNRGNYISFKGDKLFYYKDSDTKSTSTYFRFPIQHYQYVIEAKHSGKCIQVKDGSKENGSYIVQSNCDSNNPNYLKFEFEYLSNNRFNVRCVDSNKFWMVKDSGITDNSPLFQQLLSGSSMDQYEFSLKHAGGGYFFIIVPYCDKYIKVKGASLDNNSSLCLGLPAQENYIENNMDQYKFKLTRLG